jgi:hypothetical protein
MDFSSMMRGILLATTSSVICSKHGTSCNNLLERPPPFLKFVILERPPPFSKFAISRYVTWLCRRRQPA